MFGVLDARPLLGRPTESDRFQFAQENPSQKCHPGVGGRQVLLRAVTDDALTAHRHVVLRILQAEFVHAGDNALMEQRVVVVCAEKLNSNILVVQAPSHRA